MTLDGKRPEIEIDSARTTVGENGRTMRFGTRESWAKVLEWATEGSLIDDDDGEWARGTWMGITDDLPGLLARCDLLYVENLPEAELLVLVDKAMTDYDPGLED